MIKRKAIVMIFLRMIKMKMKMTVDLKVILKKSSLLLANNSCILASVAILRKKVMV